MFFSVWNLVLIIIGVYALFSLFQSETTRGRVVAGSIVAEQVFSVPGIGRLLISSISNRDYPVVQAIVLYITSVVVLINFAVDMIYQVLDPRVRTAEE